MTANKPRETFTLSERHTDEVKLFARMGELVRARSQFAVAPAGDAWELSYPDTTETRL
jgi:hypothetical protein